MKRGESGIIEAAAQCTARHLLGRELMPDEMAFIQLHVRASVNGKARNKRLTPRQLAEMWGVSPEKVLGWIRSGQLSAVNMSNGNVRPRYVVTPDAIEAFERKRSLQKVPPPQRRRQQESNVTEFY